MKQNFIFNKFRFINEDDCLSMTITLHGQSLSIYIDQTTDIIYTFVCV